MGGGKVKTAGRGHFNYPEGLVAPQQPIILDGRPPLELSTKVSGPYEENLKKLLLKMGIEAHYAPLNFDLRGRGPYPPDFITQLYIEGRQVVFETHNFWFDPDRDMHIGRNRYLARMGRFRRHHENVYLILVESHIIDETQPSVEIERRNPKKRKVDEYWHMPRMRKKKQYRRKDRKRWKRAMRTELEKLVERASHDRQDNLKAAARASA